MQALRWTMWFHKWAGLLIGVQIILWVAGGLVMTAFPIERVRSEHMIAHPAPEALALDDVLAPAEAVARGDVTGVTNARLTRTALGAVYLLDTLEDGPALVDAVSGARLSPLDEPAARAIAEADYAGEAGIASVELLEDPPIEYRRPGPVWRITFDDARASAIYVSPDTGEVRARRSNLWRFYDFFWMLHTMDYSGRDDFNHPLVVSASGFGLIFAISGIVLLVMRLTPRRRARSGESNG